MRSLTYFLFICMTMVACFNRQQDTPASDGVTAPPSEIPGSDGISETALVVDPSTGEPTLGEKPVYALSSAIGPSPVKKIDQKPVQLYDPDPQTAQEQRVVRVLTTEVWAVWMLIRIKDKPANRQNQGAWFKFQPDGTYEYGYFGEKIASGTWQFDGAKALLHLDSELEGDDREWSIKMGNQEDVMVWVGTERYHTTDIQLKLHRLPAIPQSRTDVGLTK